MIDTINVSGNPIEKYRSKERASGRDTDVKREPATNNKAKNKLAPRFRDRHCIAEEHEPFFIPVQPLIPQRCSPLNVNTLKILTPHPPSFPHPETSNPTPSSNLQFSKTPPFHHGLQNTRPFNARSPPNLHCLSPPYLQNVPIISSPARRDSHRNASAETRRRFQRRVRESPYSIEPDPYLPCLPSWLASSRPQVADLFLSRCRMFGFLLGSTLAGAGTYYYILEEYKVSNELLTEDIYVSRDSVDELYERVAI